MAFKNPPAEEGSSGENQPLRRGLPEWMFRARRAISDAELMAYVEGKLSPELDEEVRWVVAGNPGLETRLAEMTARWRAQGPFVEFEVLEMGPGMEGGRVATLAELLEKARVWCAGEAESLVGVVELGRALVRASLPGAAWILSQEPSQVRLRGPGEVQAEGGVVEFARGNGDRIQVQPGRGGVWLRVRCARSLSGAIRILRVVGDNAPGGEMVGQEPAAREGKLDGGEFRGFVECDPGTETLSVELPGGRKLVLVIRTE